MAETGEAFEKLVDVMRTLRSPEGCPWDRDQTLDSLTHFVLEEAHEVVDAIERGDMGALREEIGDHIFEGVFLAQIAAESGLFTIDDSLRTVVEKLLRRHPHVFQENGRVHDADIQRARAVGRGGARSVERAQGAGAGRLGPAALDARQRTEEPALPASRLQNREARRHRGIRMGDHEGCVAKIEEEVAELRETLEKEPDNAARAEEEMGDLLLCDREPLTQAGDRAGGGAEKSERQVHEAGSLSWKPTSTRPAARWTARRWRRWMRSGRGSNPVKTHDTKSAKNTMARRHDDTMTNLRERFA